MNRVRLNVFQQVMRLWDRVVPYNGVQMMRLRGQTDVSQINEAWRETLRCTGLGQTVVEGNQYLHRLPECEVVARVSDESMDQTVTRELNQRIDPDRDCSLRPFIIREAKSFIVGVTYLHWIADSVAIRLLMYQWLMRICGQPIAADSLETADRGYWHYFGPNSAHWHVADAAMDLLRYRTRFGRVRPMAESGDYAVEWSWHETSPQVLPRLIDFAHEQGVTLNDVLLAALAEAVDRFGANPHARGKDELAFGTVVDLRGGEDSTRELFGLFLGFTTTIVNERHLCDFDGLIRVISRQTALHKRKSAAASSQLRMAAALAEASLTTPEQWAAAYRKRMPMAAGISNVNMNRTGFAALHPHPLQRYFRAAPTGPLLPIVVSPTTLGDSFGFGLTRQKALVSSASAMLLAECMMRRLENIGTTSSAECAASQRYLHV